MKELWLFTTRYPYGLLESFLENEIGVLCERFERVRIFPEFPEGPLRPVPSNATVELLVEDPFRAASATELFASAPRAFKLFRSVLRDVPSWSVLREEWPALRSRIAQLVRRSNIMEANLMPDYDPDRVLVYTYWTHDWTTLLGLMHGRHPQLRIISRAHGFDLFEEQNLNNWIPFRSFQLDHVSKVYCVSRTGMEHLQQRDPTRSDRYELAQLGTLDHGIGPYDPTGPLKVVSCSFLSARKRVLLLIEALSKVEQPVHWTHFGGGDEEVEVAEAVSRLPKHIRADMRGMTSNSEVIAWYKQNPVDVFLHLSYLEGGVAVAVQEATSFGIPVIVADSGGVRELVGPRTGVLLRNDPSPEEVAKLLDGFRESHMNSSSFRDGVRATWLSGFEATTVFHHFVDRILGLK